VVLFKPAITLGMVLAGALPTLRGLILSPAQLLGAICAAGVVSCIVPVDIDMVQIKLAPDTSVAQGVFLEMVCTIVAITVKQC
jgi:aquaporin related protein